VNALETKRLLLRPPMLNDLEDLAAALREPALLAFLGDEAATGDGARALIVRESAACARDGIGLYSVVDPDRGHVVGLCGLRRTDLGGAATIIALCAIDPDHRRKGYAAEALEALRRHAASGLGIGSLRALIDPGNSAALGLARKTGLTARTEVDADGRSMILCAAP
jgi:RimJ/RimL family protein N-acetyltransferase